MESWDHVYNAMNGQFGRSVIMVGIGLVAIVIFVACIDGSLGARKRRRAKSPKETPKETPKSREIESDAKDP